MKALLKPDAGPGLALADVPVPQPGPGEILVKVFGGGICGTDLHIVTWDAWARSRLAPPRVIGHEFCGTIAAVGPGATDLAVGEFISGEGHISCGRCHACRAGAPHICERLEVIGIDRDGAFAEYVVMPAANAWKVGPDISRDVSAIMDPLGNAVHAALATSLAARRVAVSGCRPIGLLTIGSCHLVGVAYVAATDLSETRLGLARRLGAVLVLDGR